MDWAKVRDALVQVAPMLAGTLGSPVAGVAVKVLCDVLSLPATATPAEVSAKLLSATPEQLVTLRRAEIDHVEFMAQIGYTSLEQLTADRADARKREEVVKDRTPAVLAALAVAGFFLLTIYAALGAAPDPGMHDTFLLLTGAAVALSKDVFGYYFGSSQGSREKDATIQGLSK
jgi:hypothetical protein